MERNIRLLVAYDGTNYQGWQRQREGPTIQETIEKTLARITQQTISLVGAGRTDAGVHAWGQVANFKTTSLMAVDKMKSALQALLPGDILIRRIQEADTDFHARYSCRAKVYDYLVCDRSPSVLFFRQFFWFVREPVDWELVKAGLTLLKGKQDFSSFQSQGSEVASAVRTLYQADLLHLPRIGWKLRFMADGFLRHMVRNMTGTLIRVGLGRISIEEFEEIIHSRDRSRAGEMAPAQGLFLRKVLYS